MATDNKNRIGWRYRKFDRTCLKENQILHRFCSMHLFDQIHRLWDNEVFWFFELFFWNCNKTITVEDTLNLITHSRKRMKMCIFFIRDTFLIWFTVYEILGVFWKMAAENLLNERSSLRYSTVWPFKTKPGNPIPQIVESPGSWGPSRWRPQVVEAPGSGVHR